MSNSKQNGVSIGVLAGLSLVVGGASTSANATMISDSASFDLFTSASETDDTTTGGSESASGNANTVVSLNQFNTALGTLTGVTFSLMSRIEESGLYLNVSQGNETAQGSADATINQMVSDTVTGTLFSANGTVSASCIADFSCNDNTTFTNIANDINSISPFSGYMGMGIFNVTFSEALLLDVNLLQGGLASANANANWFGTISVEYTYDEAQVPEPLTLPLIGIGLAGLAAIRRRKSKT